MKEGDKVRFKTPTGHERYGQIVEYNGPESIFVKMGSGVYYLKEASILEVGEHKIAGKTLDQIMQEITHHGCIS